MANPPPPRSYWRDQSTQHAPQLPETQSRYIGGLSINDHDGFQQAAATEPYIPPVLPAGMGYHIIKAAGLTSELCRPYDPWQTAWAQPGEDPENLDIEAPYHGVQPPLINIRDQWPASANI